MNPRDIKIGDVFEENPGREPLRSKRRLFCVAGKRPCPETRHACAEIALISLGLVRKMPYVIPWEEFSSLLVEGKWVLTSEKPDPTPIRSLDDLKEPRRSKFQVKLQANEKLIGPVISLGWGAFVESARGAKIAEIAGGKIYKSTHSARWIRELLKSHWRSGGNPLSLGPDYSACGAPSRAERRRRALESKTDVVCPKRPGRAVTIVDPREEMSASGATSEPGRGGTSIHPSADPIILQLIDGFLDDKQNRELIEICLDRYKGLPWARISRSVRRGLRDYPEFGNLRPTRRQVAYLGLKSVNVMAVLKSALGAREVTLNYRAKKGDYRDVCDFAGQRYEIDITEADIHLVDDVSGFALGRVFVVFVVDRYTGMIVGVYVVSDDINFAHIGRALHGAFSNKDDWCRLMGYSLRKGAWPCEGVPEDLIADNAQLATIAAAETIPEWVSDLGLARSYRGDDKPQVEVTFYLANHGYVHLYGMGVTNGPKKRAKADPAKKAYISVRTFTRELINWVVEVANHRPIPTDRWLHPEFLKLRKDLTPFNYWNWSVGIGGSDQAGLGGPPRRYDPTRMMPRLLERGAANMTEYGLELGGVYFDLPGDESFQQAKALTTYAGQKTIIVYFDALTTQQIYMFPDDPAGLPTIYPIAHISRDDADLTFDTVKIRARYRAGLTKGTQKTHEEKSADAQEVQRAAAAADMARLKEKHGTLAHRNANANGLDKDTLREIQITAENDAVTKAIHGAPNPARPENGNITVPSSPVRPPCFE